MENLKEKLEDFAPLLAADLTLISQRNFALEDDKLAGEVSTLVFEYFFPLLEISFYPTNADQDQLGYKELIEGQGVLKDVPESQLILLDKERNALSKAYQDLGNTFAHWFAHIWEESGGKELGIPAFLLTDDDSMMKFDLSKKIWLKDDSYK
jgi:hypothetical protein